MLIPSKVTLYVISLGAISSLFAHPKGMQCTHGTASLGEKSSNHLQITTSDRAILHWQEFSINRGEITEFIQPGVSSAVLNRVLGSNPSELLGTLTSNGQLFLINPAGILVGQDAMINTASFIASTFDVLDEAFLAKGDLTFSGDSQNALINLGTIRANDSDVVLLAHRIENKGSIEAQNGVVALGGAHEILLMAQGKERIFIRPQTSAEKSSDTAILNEGQIKAIQAELKADGNLYALAIRDKGSIDALGVKEQNGRILLLAEDSDIALFSTMSAKNGDQTGGEVQLLAKNVVLTNSCSIDASGDFGGGKVLIGGDYQGKNPDIYNAMHTYVSEGASINADCHLQGDGGKVIVWGNNASHMLGSISALGGSLQGNGGLIEISSPLNLDFRGNVTTLATNGKTGILLLDPKNVAITSTQCSGTVLSCPSGIYQPPSSAPCYDVNGIQYAALLNTTIQTALASCNVTILTSDNGSFTGDTVLLQKPISWASNNSLSIGTPSDRIGFFSGNPSGNAIITNTGSGSISIYAKRGLSLQSNASGNIGITVNNGNITLDTNESGSQITLLNCQLIATGSGSITAKCPSRFSLLYQNLGYGLASRLETTSGNITITANELVSNASTTKATSGNITITTTGFVNLNYASVAPNSISTSSGAINITSSSNDIGIDRSTISSTSGAITLSAREITVSALQGLPASISTGGNITLSSGSQGLNVLTDNTVGAFSFIDNTSPGSKITINAQNGHIFFNGSLVSLESLSPVEITLNGNGENCTFLNSTFNCGDGFTFNSPGTGSQFSMDKTIGIINNGATFNCTGSASSILLFDSSIQYNGTMNISMPGAFSSLSLISDARETFIGNTANSNFTTQLVSPLNINIAGDILLQAGNVTSPYLVSTAGTAYLGTAVDGLAQNSGDITISANNITLTGGAGNANYNNRALIQTNDGTIGGTGNITINTTEFISLQGGSGSPGQNEARIYANHTSADINITTFGLGLFGGSGNNSEAQILTKDGNISITSSPNLLHPINLELRGGSGSLSTAEINTSAGVGTININAPLDIVLLQGGSGTTSLASIISSQITINAGTLDLVGGSSSSNSRAQITDSLGGTGDISITTTGPVQLAGGSGSGQNQAQIVTNFGASQNITMSCGGFNLFGGSGDNSEALINTVLGNGNISITSTASMNIIGGSGAFSRAFINTTPGGSALQISALDHDLSLTGGTGNNSAAFIESSQINIAAGNINLTGGSGATNSQASINTGTPPSNSITITATGRLKLQGGSGSGLTEAEIHALLGDIAITCNGFSLFGGNGANSKAQIFTDDASINIISSNFMDMIGGSGTFSTATITAAGMGRSINISASGHALTLAGGTGTISPATILAPGAISISAGDVNLFGGNASGALNNTQALIETSDPTITNNISIDATGVITLHGGIGVGLSKAKIHTQGVSSSDIAIDCAGLNLFGGGGDNSEAQILTDNGSIMIASTGNVVLQGGTGTHSNADIIASGSGKIIEIFAPDPDLFLGAGTGVISPAQIIARDITITARNVNLLGGSANDVSAQNWALIKTNGNGGNGNITIEASGLTTVRGGTGTLGNSQAQIFANNPLSGDIAITTIGLNVYGGGSEDNVEVQNVQAQILTDNGNITVISSEGALLNGIQLKGGEGSNSEASITAFGIGKNIEFLAPLQNFLMAGGSGSVSPAFILANTGSVAINANPIDIGGTFALQGGTGEISYATISAGSGNFTGQFMGDVALIAGSNQTSFQTYASIDAPTGNILLTGNSFELQSTAGPGDASSSIFAGTSTSGSVVINATGDIQMLGQGDVEALIQSNKASTSITADGFITLSGTALMTANQGAITVIAGTNMTLEAGSTISNTGNFPLTLVIDNQFPNFPDYGASSFNLLTGASVISGGDVRIFTSVRTLNTIQTTINGQTFVPGTLYVNSNTERWGVYYPNDFYGTGNFVLFYKENGTNPPAPGEPGGPPAPGEPGGPPTPGEFISVEDRANVDVNQFFYTNFDLFDSAMLPYDSVLWLGPYFKVCFDHEKYQDLPIIAGQLSYFDIGECKDLYIKRKRRFPKLPELGLEDPQL